MKFIAEIKTVKMSKSVSNDKVASLLIVTDNCDIMALAAYPADTLFTIDIEPEEI